MIMKSANMFYRKREQRTYSKAVSLFSSVLKLASYVYNKIIFTLYSMLVVTGAFAKVQNPASEFAFYMT